MVSLMKYLLFFKHNLNARASASIKGKVDQVRVDLSRLIREMEASIAEADAFIKDHCSGYKTRKLLAQLHK